MASVTKCVGKRSTSYEIRWYYPVENGPAEEQTVRWGNYSDARTLKAIIEARGSRVRKTDPDVLDHSIVTGKPTRPDLKPAAGPTVPAVIEEFLAQRAREGVKASTIAAYQSANRAGLLRAVWAEEYTANIDVEMVQALQDHIARIGMDHRAPMQFLRSLILFAISRGYLETNPLKLVKQPRRVRKFLARYLSQEEFARLLACVPETDEFWLFLVTAWDTGLRAGEICALERDDITVVNGKAYITVSKTVALSKDETTPPKSGKPRMVAITPELADRLLAPGRHPQRIFPARQNANGWLGSSYVTKRFAVVRKAAKLTGRQPRFHDLRHSHASNLLGDGVDMYVVSLRLGHTSIAITYEFYSHLGKKAEDAVLSAVTGHTVL